MGPTIKRADGNHPQKRNNDRTHKKKTWKANRLQRAVESDRGDPAQPGGRSKTSLDQGAETLPCDRGVDHEALGLTWRGVQDSNLRRCTPTNLQSDPIGRSGNSPSCLTRLGAWDNHQARHQPSQEKVIPQEGSPFPVFGYLGRQPFQVAGFLPEHRPLKRKNAPLKSDAFIPGKNTLNLMVDSLYHVTPAGPRTLGAPNQI